MSRTWPYGNPPECSSARGPLITCRPLGHFSPLSRPPHFPPDTRARGTRAAESFNAIGFSVLSIVLSLSLDSFRTIKCAQFAGVYTVKREGVNVLFTSRNCVFIFHVKNITELFSESDIKIYRPIKFLLTKKRGKTHFARAPLCAFAGRSFNFALAEAVRRPYVPPQRAGSQGIKTNCCVLEC